LGNAATAAAKDEYRQMFDMCLPLSGQLEKLNARPLHSIYCHCNTQPPIVQIQLSFAADTPFLNQQQKPFPQLFAQTRQSLHSNSEQGMSSFFPAVHIL